MSTTPTPTGPGPSPTASDRGPVNAPEFSVSEIASALKRTLEGAFGHVRVRGEVSGLKRPASGHIYFDLKDEKAVINSVCWKGVASRLKFLPEDGLEVIVTGKISTYAPRSNYQLVVDTVEPAGAGALMAMLEERRKKLAAEGLFDAARKKPVPYLPSVIGVVTSPTGAVIRDILHRLADRFPRHVLVWPVQVQGERAADQIAAAIEGFNALPKQGAVPRPDVLIVARGGGSLEDLWAFNEEVVVRAAAASDIALISAVGHETDTTLIDFAADLRAPTPTAAAELAVPVRAELVATLSDLERRRRQGATRLMDEWRQRVVSLGRGLPRLQDLMGLQQQKFDDLAERLPRALRANTQQHGQRLSANSGGLRRALLNARIQQSAQALSLASNPMPGLMKRQVEGCAQRLDAAARMLASLSYQSVLSRGYAVVRDHEGRPVVTSVGHKPGSALELEFKDGRTDVIVAGGKPGDPPGQGEKRKTPSKSAAKNKAKAKPKDKPKDKPKSPDDQGTLFS